MRHLLRVTCLTLLAQLAAAQDVVPAAGETLEVAAVWSGHPVGFSLYTAGDIQLIAYYDAERRMTVASRRLDSSEWHTQVLPSVLGWDSHNSITLAVDAADQIHVVGNLHADPLVYFRSSRALDVTSLRRVEKMVGSREERMTYPVFLQLADGRLVFRYRDGGSGNGDDLLNVYDHQTQRWQRLLDAPLLSGGGEVNGYFSTPTQGPDGRFHIVGVWRDTPDCATNHDVSYARSDDLVHWERADGQPLSLPLTPATIDIVDPVPAGGGVINGNVRLGFDPEHRPVVSYHKYDDEGHTRIHCARFENGAWRVRPVGDLGDYRWDFSGGGSIAFDVHVGAVRTVDAGHLALDASFPGGSRHWLLDADKLTVVGKAKPLPSPLPTKLRAVESEQAGMQRRIAWDTGRPPQGTRFALLWDTLPRNRDRPRDGAAPPPSTLRLARVRSGEAR